MSGATRDHSQAMSGASSSSSSGKTFRTERSELFSRLEAFLPTMQAANEALAEQADDPKRHDIEELSNPEGPHIEMNLACGVLEAQPTEADVPTDEPIDELQLPTRQTAAVARAAQAGRVLVSEVEDPPPKRPAPPAEEPGEPSADANRATRQRRSSD